MSNALYDEFVDRLNRQNQFVIQYDPDAMDRAVTIDGVSRRPAAVNILIAGTNGKGSIASYLHGLCCAAGLKVGLYTSPHLVSFRERIRINGDPISQDDVVRFGSDLFERYGDADHREDIRTLSYFELTTLLALRYFEAVGSLDVCIFEVGLGGRLDATNVVEPDITCFGSVSLDHQNLLGETIALIAREKAGVARAGRPAFVHRENGGVEALVEALKETDALISYVEPGQYDVVGLDRHQRGSAVHRNREIAVTAFCEATATLNVEKSRTRAAVRRGPTVTRWPGRQTIEVRDQRRYLLDGAHNVEAMQETAAWLHRILGAGVEVPVIMGVSGSRDVCQIAEPIRPWIRELILSEHVGESAESVESMAARWKESHPEVPVKWYSGIGDAISSLPTPSDCIICGSLYLIGDAYESLGYGEARIPPIIE